MLSGAPRLDGRDMLLVALSALFWTTHAGGQIFHEGNVNLTRSKRQHYATAPLFADCSEYQPCAPPSVCYTGRCQCMQPYTTLASSCISAQAYAAPPMAAPQMIDSRAYAQNYPQQPPHGVDPSFFGGPAPAQPPPAHPQPQMVPPPPVRTSTTFRQVYTDGAQLVAPQFMQPVAPVARVVPVVPAARVVAPQPVVYFPAAQPMQPPQRIHIHDTTYIREHIPVPPPQPIPAPPAVPIPHPTVPLPTATVPTTTEARIETTSQPRFFDSPSIAYPGDFCQMPQTVCVGGSICVQNVCSCRRGEEIYEGQCVRVEIPITVEQTTTEVPTTTVAPTTQSPTTTTEQTTVTTPTTTTTTTTTPTPTTTYISTTWLPSTNPSTIPSTTYIPSTATMVLPQADEINRCTQCCPQGQVMSSQGCVPGQVVRINLLVSGPGQQCMNSAQCTRGAYCSQGHCRCATRYATQGSSCIRRR